jgi:hypothetical protein
MKEYKEFKEFKEFKEYEGAPNVAPPGSRILTLVSSP